MTSLGPGMVGHTFNLRRQKQADLSLSSRSVLDRASSKKKNFGPSVVVHALNPRSQETGMQIFEFKVS